jgi:ATP-dependent DNA helicase RecG
VRLAKRYAYRPVVRFSIKEENYSMASRIIKDTLDVGLVKPYDPENTSKKHAKYVPFWA